MVRLTDPPAMIIAVDLGRKAAKQKTKQTKVYVSFRILVRTLWKVTKVYVSFRLLVGTLWNITTV